MAPAFFRGFCIWGVVVRARNIKPAFFKNEDLAECTYPARMLFIGLWCMAYRDGIVEYRPKRIKAEIFPYEDRRIGIEKLLEQLRKLKFISILEKKETNHKIIVVNNFKKHQSPHRNEKTSGIDNLEDYQEITCNSMKVISPLMNDERGIMNDERGMMINAIFENWNKRKIIRHRDVKKYEKHISSKFELYSMEELLQAIDNYALVLHDDRFFWSKTWNLEQFLNQKNALDRFLPENFMEETYLKREQAPRVNTLKDAQTLSRHQVAQALNEEKENDSTDNRIGDQKQIDH